MSFGFGFGNNIYGLNSVFDPLSLLQGGQQGLLLPIWDTSFLRGSDGVSAATVDAAVGKVLDSSPNAHSFVQSIGGNQPLLKQDGNGVNYLRGDGIDDWMQAASFNAATNGSPGFSSVLLCKFRSIPATASYAYQITTGASNARCLNGVSVGVSGAVSMAGRRLDTDSAARFLGNGVPADTALNSIGCRFDTPNAYAYLYRNNVLLHTDSAYFSPGNFSPTNSTNVSIFAAGGGGSSGTVDIYSMFWIARALSETELFNVSTYLMQKAKLL